MKIFVFTDLHSDVDVLKDIKKTVKKEKPELILCGGDLSIFGSLLELVIHELDSLNVPILIVHGNHETEDEMKLAEEISKNITQIHNKGKVIGEYLFLGYGGGGFLVNDPKFEKVAKKFESIIAKNKDKKVVLISHGPPYGTVTDDMPGLGHVGNKNVTKFIKKFKPILILTGHLHDCENRKQKVGNTLIINPGAKGRILNI